MAFYMMSGFEPGSSVPESDAMSTGPRLREGIFTYMMYMYMMYTYDVAKINKSFCVLAFDFMHIYVCTNYLCT
jgi:hypothetical protein